MYILAAGDRLISLWCDATSLPPDDRWLSIAESFEFLPAEE